MKAFHETVRQPFISESYYEALAKHFLEGATYWLEKLPEGDTLEEQRSLAASMVADDAYMLLSLHYTAGEPIEKIREELEGIVAAYERYQKALGEYEEAPEMAPFGFERIDDFERCMQLIGLCYLLHRRDLLPRIAKLQGPGYEAEDAVYEDLLSYALEDRYDINEWYHDKPYTLLIDAMYAETPEDASKNLKAYCEAWYPAMKDCPWHDGHLRMTATDGDYFGYWAFEAGAVAYLLDIDDNSIDHMVYPKDLVAYARKLRDDGLTAPRPDSGRLRGLPNQLVPKTGWWWSPAFSGADALRHFNQGDHFPPTETTNYGGVFWYYDADRQPKE